MHRRWRSDRLEDSRRLAEILTFLITVLITWSCVLKCSEEIGKKEQLMTDDLLLEKPLISHGLLLDEARKIMKYRRSKNKEQRSTSDPHVDRLDVGYGRQLRVNSGRLNKFVKIFFLNNVFVSKFILHHIEQLAQWNIFRWIWSTTEVTVNVYLLISLVNKWVSSIE